MSGASYQIVVLGEEAYDQQYSELIQESEYQGALWEDEVEEEFEAFDEMLREALGARWDEDPFMEGDIAISEVFRGCYHHSAVICNSSVCCPEFVRAVMDVMSMQRHAAQWSFHATIEVVDPDDPGMLEDDNVPLGEFFIWGGRMWVPRDCPELRRWFGDPDDPDDE